MDQKETSRLEDVDMIFPSLAGSERGVARGLSGNPGAGQKRGSLKTVNKMARVERSNSDRQLALGGVLQPASITETPSTNSPEMSTESPGDCRPRKSLDQASKSAMLSDADLSVAMEMCMGINEELVTNLWSNMNLIKMLNNNISTVSVPDPVKTADHAKGQKPREVVMRTLTISHEKLGTVCARPKFNSLETGMYLMLSSANGASMYLVAQKKHGLASLSRLVLNSSLEGMTTVLLATSKYWRISGSSRAVSQIKGQHEISIAIEDVTVTLVRSVDHERVYYDITVQLKTRGDVIYGGILGDLLAVRSASRETKGHPKPSGQEICRSISAQQRTVTKYRSSFCTFMEFFTNLLNDLAYNLPSTIFE